MLLLIMSLPLNVVVDRLNFHFVSSQEFFDEEKFLRWNEYVTRVSAFVPEVQLNIICYYRT